MSVHAVASDIANVRHSQAVTKTLLKPAEKCGTNVPTVHAWQG